jgi:hypothetical protein
MWEIHKSRFVLLRCGQRLLLVSHLAIDPQHFGRRFRKVGGRSIGPNGGAKCVRLRGLAAVKIVRAGGRYSWSQAAGQARPGAFTAATLMPPRSLLATRVAIASPSARNRYPPGQLRDVDSDPPWWGGGLGPKFVRNAPGSSARRTPRVAPAITIAATMAPTAQPGANTVALVPGRPGRSWRQAAAATRAPGSRPTPPRRPSPSRWADHPGPPDGAAEPVGAATGAPGAPLLRSWVIAPRGGPGHRLPLVALMPQWRQDYPDGRQVGRPPSRQSAQAV